MRLYTTALVPDAKKTSYKGFVISNTVRSRNMFSSMGSGFKSMVGGEIGGQTQLMSDSRNIVIQNIIAQAQQLGANAIVGLKLETSELSNGTMFDIVAYGTAVYME